MKRVFMVLMGVLFLYSCQRDLSEFDYLLEPQITPKSAQQVLVIEVKGDPNAVGGEGFGQLFKSFYALKKEYQDLKMAPPRARWPLSADVPVEEWIGRYALPLNVIVEELPVSDKISPNARIEKWYGGDVAEILHLGAYEDESPTIDKLLEFIDEQGYEIVGQHEEEYLRGPGILFKGNPQKYRTIIRYEVRKKAAQSSEIAA
jgi:hypothetical protein